MPLPTVTNDPLNTVLGQKNYITITPQGGTAVSFLSEKLSVSPSNETVRREVLFSDGLIRADRIVPTKRKDVLKFETSEIKKVISLLGGLGGFKQGTAEIWCVDPQDAAGKCSIHYPSFKCLVTAEGDTSLSSTEFGKTTISLEATEALAPTTDFTIV